MRINKIKNASATPDRVAVFRFRPWDHGCAAKWICFPCAAPAFDAGKFHAPVTVLVVDLEGCKCVICGVLVADADWTSYWALPPAREDS